jgi:hypothetical protein
MRKSAATDPMGWTYNPYACLIHLANLCERGELAVADDVHRRMAALPGHFFGALKMDALEKVCRVAQNPQTIARLVMYFPAMCYARDPTPLETVVSRTDVSAATRLAFAAVLIRVSLDATEATCIAAAHGEYDMVQLLLHGTKVDASRVLTAAIAGSSQQIYHLVVSELHITHFEEFRLLLQCHHWKSAVAVIGRTPKESTDCGQFLLAAAYTCGMPLEGADGDCGECKLARRELLGAVVAKFGAPHSSVLQTAAMQSSLSALADAIWSVILPTDRAHDAWQTTVDGLLVDAFRYGDPVDIKPRAERLLRLGANPVARHNHNPSALEQWLTRVDRRYDLKDKYDWPSGGILTWKPLWESLLDGMSAVKQADLKPARAVLANALTWRAWFLVEGLVKHGVDPCRPRSKGRPSAWDLAVDSNDTQALHAMAGRPRRGPCTVPRPGIVARECAKATRLKPRPELLGMLLNDGYDANEPGRDGRVPLEIVCTSAHGAEDWQRAYAKELIMHGASTKIRDAAGRTLLRRTIEDGNLLWAVELARGGAWAAEPTGSTLFVETLVARAASPVYSPPACIDLLDCAVGDLTTLSVPECLRSFPILSAAISEGLTQATIGRLIRFGLDVRAPDGWGRRPMYYAIKGDNAKAAELLIRNGASIYDVPTGEPVAYRPMLVRATYATLERLSIAQNARTLATASHPRLGEYSPAGLLDPTVAAYIMKLAMPDAGPDVP